MIILIIFNIDTQGQNGTTIFNILDNTTEFIIGEIFSSGGATLYKNPSDQTMLCRLGFNFYKKMIDQTNIENVTKAMKLNGLESKTDFNMANMNDTEMGETCNTLRRKDWAVVKIRIGDENSDLIKRDLRVRFEDKIAAFGKFQN